MIKPTDVLRQLIRRLPNETDRFCGAQITITNLRIEGGYLKFNAASVLPYFIVNKLKMLNPCVAVYNPVTNTTTITTTNKNKITTPLDSSTNKLDTHVETDVGFFRIVLSSNGFEFQVAGNASAATILKEPIIYSAGLNQNISTMAGVVSAKLKEASYDCVCEGAVFDYRLNLNVMPTTARMVDHYASLPKNTSALWAYVVFGERNTISKPNADAGIISEARGTNDEILKVSTSFDVYVWWGTDTSQEAAKKQQDEAFGDVYDLMNRCLFGHISDETGAGDWQCIPRSNQIAEADTLPNYVHRYSYLVVESIRYSENGQRQDVDYFNEPFSKVDFSLFIQSGSEQPQELKIDIDYF